jgi:preprotein translocase subunit SecY
MLSKILSTLANCLRVPELKSRLLFTLALLAVCRVVAIIPLPGLNGPALSEFIQETQRTSSGASGLVGMYSLFTGGALERCALGALGIMPYISATIIIQLLGAVVPSLSKLAREEGGRMKIVQYSRYLTLVLCLGQGFAMALGWENPQTIFPNFPDRLVIMEPIWWYRLQTVLLLTAATMLLVWLGEQITERGIGNGVSLIITIGILARLPQTARGVWYMFNPPTDEGGKNLFHALALILLLVAVVAAIIAVTQAQRKIPVQYAQRSVGRKVVPGGSSFMPLRVNAAGVMPIIFAQAILMFPEKLLTTLGGRFDQLGFLRTLGATISYGQPAYLLLEAGMIIFFSYFWVATIFNEIQIADDLKKYGGYIPGVRPGQATSDFLHWTMSRITLAGAVFLAVIAIFPVILYRILDVPFDVASFFGGTSILITVGVLLDTLRQVESFLLMRHYDGFLKKGRVRGRF